jgi:hypothetical protein
VPDGWLAGPALERSGWIAGLGADENVEAVVTHADAENLRSRRAGAVGAVCEKVGKSREPEQVVGSRIVTKLELEVGERAPRRGQWDTHASGPPAALAPSSSVEGAHETDGAEAEDPGADDNCADVVTVPCRQGVVGSTGHVRSDRVVVVRVVVVCGR